MRFRSLVLVWAFLTLACSRKPRERAARPGPGEPSSSRPVAATLAKGVADGPFAVASGRTYWVARDGGIRKRDVEGNVVVVLPAGDVRAAGIDAMAASEDRLIWNDSLAGLFVSDGHQIRSVDVPVGNWTPAATSEGFYVRANDTPRPLIRIGLDDAAPVEITRESYGGWELCAANGVLVIAGTSLRATRPRGLSLVEATVLSELSLSQISCSGDGVVGFSSDLDGGAVVHVSLLNGDAKKVASVPYWSVYKDDAIVGGSVFVLFGVPRWPDGLQPAGEAATHLMRLVRYPLHGPSKPQAVDSWVGCPGMIRTDSGYVFWTDPCEGVLNRIGPFSDVTASTRRSSFA